MSKDLLPFFEMRRQLSRRLQELPEPQSVEKGLPIAFPIEEVEHTICQLVTEPLGLVQRYLAEAVARFQPVTARQIDEWLGLGEAFIVRMLEDLITNGADLYRDGLIYKAGPRLQQNALRGTFERTIVQRRRFLVNGVTNKLLPIDFLKSRQDFRLFLGDDRDAPMLDRLGDRSAVSVKVVDRLCFGREHLTDLIRNGDTASREEVGLPKGATGLDLSAPAVCVTNWVLAFILVRRGGAVEVLAAGDHNVWLHDESCSTLHYWKEVCSPAWFSGDRLATDNETALTILIKSWPADIQATFDRKTNQAWITIENLEVNLPLTNEAEVDENDAMRRLRSALIAGTYWDPKTLLVLHLGAGDQATAGRVCVLRGVQALQRKLRQVNYLPEQPPPVRLSDWWRQWQREFTLTLKLGFELGAGNLEELLMAARSVRDTDFADKLDWINDENG